MSAELQKLDFVIIGQIVKPHGVRGAVKVLVLADDPNRFSSLKHVYLGDEDHQGEAVAVNRVQSQNSNVILTLENVSSREDADLLRRKYVKIPVTETEPLPKGVHYFFELVGLRMITNAGDFIGVVKDVVSYPANNVFVVISDEREILIPDIPDIIEKVDVDAGEIVINPMQGLLD